MLYIVSGKVEESINDVKWRDKNADNLEGNQNDKLEKNTKKNSNEGIMGKQMR